VGVGILSGSVNAIVGFRNGTETDKGYQLSAASTWGAAVLSNPTQQFSHNRNKNNIKKTPLS
jgi:hypothetical protein